VEFMSAAQNGLLMENGLLSFLMQLVRMRFTSFLRMALALPSNLPKMQILINIRLSGRRILQRFSGMINSFV